MGVDKWWKVSIPQTTAAEGQVGGVFGRIQVQFMLERKQTRLHKDSVQSPSPVWLCDARGHSTPDISVHHQHPGLTQTHVHRVSDAIQWSRPLSSPSPPAFNLSRHRGLFQWVGSSHLVANVLEFQLEHQSFQWIFRTDFLLEELVGSPCSPRDSQASSPTPQFKSISSSMLAPWKKSYDQPRQHIKK